MRYSDIPRQIAQYRYQMKTPGTGGIASWDSDVACKLPSVRFFGACYQKVAGGYNLWDEELMEGSLARAGDSTYPTTNMMMSASYISVSVNKDYCFTLASPGLGDGETATVYLFYYISGTSYFSVQTILVTNQSYQLFHPPFGAKRLRFMLQRNIAQNCKISINSPSSHHEYDPYTGGVAMPTATNSSPIVCNNGSYLSGGGESVDLSSLPDGGLYGIGDVCDEWDCISGKGIRRCGVIESYANEAVGNTWISTKGSLTAGAGVVYLLNSPVPFTAEPQPIFQRAGANVLTMTGGNIPDAGVEICQVLHV